MELPPQFFTRVTLTSAHRKLDGGTPKKFNRENLLFGIKFSAWGPYNFGDSGSILRKLFSGDVPPSRDDEMGISFGRSTS